MWTKITRKKYGREKLRYASDTTDEEWALIEPLLPLPAKGRGRPRTTDLRSVVDALFYIAQSGCRVADAAEELSALHDGAAVFLPVA